MVRLGTTDTWNTIDLFALSGVTVGADTVKSYTFFVAIPEYFGGVGVFTVPPMLLLELALTTTKVCEDAYEDVPETEYPRYVMFLHE